LTTEHDVVFDITDDTVDGVVRGAIVPAPAPSETPPPGGDVVNWFASLRLPDSASSRRRRARPIDELKEDYVVDNATVSHTVMSPQNDASHHVFATPFRTHDGLPPVTIRYTPVQLR
jgi:hypothetical protein